MRPSVLVAASLAVMLAASAAMAATETIGGPGGGAFRIACGSGRFVVGLTGRSGDWMDQVAPVCVKVDVDGHWTEAPSARPATGGSGGGPFTTMCPRDFVVTGYYGYSGKYVFNLGLTCRQDGLNGSRWASPSPVLVGGNLGVTSSAGGNCGASYAASAIIGSSGIYVDRFGLDCALKLGRPILAPEPSAQGRIAGSAEKRPGDVIGKVTQPIQPAVQGYVLRCQGGPGMAATRAGDGSIRISFTPTTGGTASTPPGPGQCGWLDRGFRPGEPAMLLIAGDAIGFDDYTGLVIEGRSFAVRAYNNNQGAMVVVGRGE